MYTKGSVLRTPVDFDNAVFFGMFVEIWQGDKMVDFGGRLTKHTEDVVYIGADDDRYPKQMFQFRIR